MTRFRVAAVVVLLSVLASAAAPAARADDPPYYIPEETPVAYRVEALQPEWGQCVELWVPLKGGGTVDGPWAPDLGGPIQFTSRCGHIGAVAQERDECPLNPETGKRRPIITTYVCVIIREADLPSISTVVPLHEVPDHDKLLLRMVRCFERDRDGYLTPAAVAAVEQAFIDEQTFAETDEGYEMMIRLVYRMYWREVPLATCNRIANMLARVHASAQE